MKKLLLTPLFALLSCEPPAAVIFELNFSADVLASPIAPKQLIISFCPTATGCERIIDYQKETIQLSKTLEAKETIAFSPGNALSPQQIFFEFALIGEVTENNVPVPVVIASASTTKDIGAPSYFKRQKIVQGLVPGSSLQSVQDRTLALGTRVELSQLTVHGVGANGRDFLAQAGPRDEFPAHPFFSGITVRSSAASALLQGDCRKITGTIIPGESGDVEIDLEQNVQDFGCTNSDALPVAVNQLQSSQDPQVLDGVLLRIDDVFVQRCSFNTAFFCAFDSTDDVEVEISNFIFDDQSGNFNNTLTTLESQGSLVSIVGAGEMFDQDLFFIVPRDIGDLLP